MQKKYKNGKKIFGRSKRWKLKGKGTASPAWGSGSM